jgi:hypothetical protein
MTQETPLRATQSAETSSADVGYTKDDVRLAQDVIDEVWTDGGDAPHAARRVLAALAAAGRLLPEDTRTGCTAPIGAHQHSASCRVPGFGTVADIRKRWLQVCGSCDAGLPMSCSCSEPDPRGVISALCDLLEPPAGVGSWVPVPEAPKEITNE